MKEVKVLAFALGELFDEHGLGGSAETTRSVFSPNWGRR
jgi:hypothetical protein